LDHEAVDDAMKDGAVVVAALDVGEKVLDGLGRFGGVEFEHDVTAVGGEFDLHGLGSLGEGKGGEGAGEERREQGAAPGVHAGSGLRHGKVLYEDGWARIADSRRASGRGLG